MQILLNNTGQGNHVPEAERFVRTTKDSCHAGFYGTPFKKIPISLTIGPVLVAIFWNKSVAAEDVVSRSISPEGIINGCSLNFHKHCQIRFGSYTQTAEEDDNTIATERTLGNISIVPIGNSQVTHTFMNLNTGQYTPRTHWTPIPMPQHFIDRVHQLANTQTQGLEFRNRNNQLMISEDDGLYDNADDESYDPAEDNDATDITDVHNNKDKPPRNTPNLILAYLLS